VLTFGLNANNIPGAALGAIAAVVIVLGVAVALRRPLSMINENLLKYGVLGDTALTVLGGVAIVVAFAISLAIDVRPKRR
jgi:uncharacterized membrane protein